MLDDLKQLRLAWLDGSDLMLLAYACFSLRLYCHHLGMSTCKANTPVKAPSIGLQACPSLQELQARVAPVLARWRNKLLAVALEAFQQNVVVAQDKRQQVQRALQYWNNRALAGAFAQWIDSVEVTQTMHIIRLQK